MKWLLLIIVASLPAYLLRFHIGTFPSTVLEVLILLTFILWFAHKWRGGDNKKFFSELDQTWLITIIVWLAVSLLAVIVSPDKRAALGIWRAYFLEPILFLLVFVDTLKSVEDLRLIFAGLGVSALYISAYAIGQRFFGLTIPYPWQSELRATSIFEYPNAVGLFLAPLVPLLAAAGFRVEGLGYRVFYLGATMLSVISIILAKSEGAIVGILAGFFMLGLLWSKKTRIATLVLTALLAIMVFSIPQTRSYAVEKTTLRDWSGLVRRITWTETIEMLKNHPILGAGLAGYQKTFAPYHKTKAIEIFMYPHNIVLNFWSELSLFGLCIFAWILILFCKTILRNIPKLEIGNWKLEILLASSLTTLVVHGLVDVPYFKNDLAVLFWIIVGSALVLKRSENTIH